MTRTSSPGFPHFHSESRLPQRDSWLPQRDSAAPVSSTRAVVRKRILIVDDDHETARMLARVLGTRYDVVVAENGRQGLALAMESPGPDLVLTDVQMPDMDGLTMAQRIKSLDRGSRLPIIFLTAKSTPQDVIAGIRAGARSYLTKPVRIEELLDRVQRALDLPR